MISKFEQNRRWRETHREHLRISKHAYYLANIERRRDYNRKYHKLTYPLRRTKLLLQTKEYAQSHPEVRRRCHDNYVKRHPDRHKAQQRAAAIKGKARRRGADVGDPHVNGIVKQWKSASSFICYYCQKQFPISKLNVDHVAAVAVGGKHTLGNLCKACPKCNIRKRHHPLTQIKFLKQPVLNL